LLAGVDLYELRPDAPERSQFEAPGFNADHIGLHAKILVLDRQKLFVGTSNADPRSMLLNTEISLMIDSPELAEAVISVFSSDFQPQNSWRVMLDDKGDMSWHSSEGVLKRQPFSSAWRRVGDFLYGKLPIDDQM
jgi:putative cardiolipin synthase